MQTTKDVQKSRPNIGQSEFVINLIFLVAISNNIRVVIMIGMW